MMYSADEFYDTAELDNNNKAEPRMNWRGKRTYTVSKDERTGRWYAHHVNRPHIPILGSNSATRRAAQKHAANWMALPLEEYLKLKEVRR